MLAFLRGTILAALVLASLSATASAERVFTVNDAAGVFDQASTAVEGTKVHAAYIGGASTDGPFLVYYAALNGAADFNLSLQRSQFVVTAPVVVTDNVGGGDAYYDARHPRIAFRSSREVVIVFQARPLSAEDPFVLYRARVSIVNNLVTSVSVRKVTEGGADVFGRDVAVALDLSDNTARLAYAVPPESWGGAALSTVRYARVALDNAAVVDNSFLLSSGTDSALFGSDGVQPLPAIALDPSRRAHVAWSAAPDSGTTPAMIYYAMVKAGTTGLAGKDNVVIRATPVFEGGRKWTFPGIGAPATSSVFVLAGDASNPGIAGPIAWVELNPDADNQDGTPVDNVAFNLFRVHGPGTAPYPLYRPDIVFDATGASPIWLLTGYGIAGTTGSHYAMTINTATLSGGALAALSSYPGGTYLGSFVFPVELAGDYTRPAGGFLNGKTMAFWSGVDPSNAAVRNLFVSTIFSGTRPPLPADESGCSASAHPRHAGPTEIAGVVVLLLPAVLLGARRLSRISGPRRGDIEP